MYINVSKYGTHGVVLLCSKDRQQIAGVLMK